MARRAYGRRFGATQNDRIFFACLPDAETALRIHALGGRLKAANGFDGTQILAEHLHVTLFHLGDWNGLPEKVVEAAEQAAAEVAVVPFDVTFNLSESFKRGTGTSPFVLTGDKSAAAWRPLHVALGAALRKAGLGGAAQAAQFTPHITLLYDEKAATSAPIEQIVWTVREFVLVHSLLGKTTHIHLGRWPLRDS